MIFQLCSTFDIPCIEFFLFFFFWIWFVCYRFFLCSNIFGVKMNGRYQIYVKVGILSMCLGSRFRTHENLFNIIISFRTLLSVCTIACNKHEKKSIANNDNDVSHCVEIFHLHFMLIFSLSLFLSAKKSEKMSWTNRYAS